MGDLTTLVSQFDKLRDINRLSLYNAYPWQADFHAAGEHHAERMIMAANRVGKTLSAAAEVAFHMTGLYPDWWTGKRFDSPVLVWTGSPTNETSRDIVQAELLGGMGDLLGTGWIPKNLLKGKPTTRQAGVRNVVDSFFVKHKSGGTSRCVMKTYEQGWQKWQGAAPHVVWMDEEPDNYMIFSESITRIMTSKGIVMVTFTPLLGMTELVQHFMEGGDGIYIKSVTWDDAPHLSTEEKDRLSSSYRSYERDARTKGIPMMGEGAVFPVADEEIIVDAFDIPNHWARIKGCDFGMDHPAAGAELAWDRDADIVYVIDCYKKSQETAPYHAAWFTKNNAWLPVSWPHDGMNREKTGGRTLADAYRGYGANMMSKSARYPRTPGEKEKGGAQPQEPIIDEVLDRMLTGRFKVFSHLQEWMEEKRSYHRKDGKIVPRRDDILKATFYALMMKRYAVPISRGGRHISNAPTRPIATSRVA